METDKGKKQKAKSMSQKACVKVYEIQSMENGRA
jgi:hypothetical protein